MYRHLIRLSPEPTRLHAVAAGGSQPRDDLPDHSLPILKSDYVI
jgi:hypothetical protein